MTCTVASAKALGIVVAGAVLVSTLSGVTAVHAAESDDISVSANNPIDMKIAFATEGVTLDNGRLGPVESDPADSAKRTSVTVNDPKGGADPAAVIRFGHNRGSGSGSVIYRIFALGEATPYWVSTQIRLGSDTGRSSAAEIATESEPDMHAEFRWSYDIHERCAILKKHETDDGFDQVDNVPYKCSIKRTDSDVIGNSRFTTTVGLNRSVASSGTMTVPANSTFSLANGVFHQDQAYSGPGAATVAAGEQTTFFAVMLDSEKAKNELFRDQARTEFAYEILRDGRATGYWVGGMVTNHRGRLAFNSDRRCAIYDSNPLPKAGSMLDYARPVGGAGFTCSADGKFVWEGIAAGNIHYDATFEVTDVN